MVDKPVNLPIPSEIGIVSKTAESYRNLILQFIASLTLCDHMGDVADDIARVLKEAGLKLDYDDLTDLGHKLGKLGITTLYGTQLNDEEDEEEIPSQ